MDLIQILTSQLGLDSGQAQGLAGTVLNFIKARVAAKVGGREAQAVECAVPELGAWSETAETLSRSGGGGGLLGLAAGTIGGEIGELTSAVSKLDLDASTLQQALPIIADFLKARMDQETFTRVLSAVPFLKGFLPSPSSGGLAGALGGLLG